MGQKRGFGIFKFTPTGGTAPADTITIVGEECEPDFSGNVQTINKKTLNQTTHQLVNQGRVVIESGLGYRLGMIRDIPDVLVQAMLGAKVSGTPGTGFLDGTGDIEVHTDDDATDTPFIEHIGFKCEIEAKSPVKQSDYTMGELTIIITNGMGTSLKIDGVEQMT